MAYTAPPVSGSSWLTTCPVSQLGTGRQLVDWQFLHGRVVLVIFWSFGCEASLLQLRSVERLLAKVNGASNNAKSPLLDIEEDAAIPDLVAIGVHTPRFPYEEDESRVRNAIKRERITLPVIHDPEFITWNRYNPGGWPATVVIGKDQTTIGVQVGNGDIELLSSQVELAMAATTSKPKRTIQQFFGQRRRAEDQIEASAETTITKDTNSDAIDVDTIELTSGNSFAEQRTPDSNDKKFDSPMGLAIHSSGLMAVADSGNDRVLVGTIDSEKQTFLPTLAITDIVSPTGLAIRNESELYVIERSSGSVIGINLAEYTTRTVARSFVSPSGLCIDTDGSVVVADAGDERLLRIVVAHPGEILVGPIAGSGATGFGDGPADKATLAQPVAVARSKKGLLFCDAASSNIRLLSDDGSVASITNNGFFQWGLVDGPIYQAKLQRPSGIAVLANESIVIADTGNDKLRLLKNQRLTTLGVTELKHPTGLASLSETSVAVADTGNNRILVVSPATKEAWALNLGPIPKSISHRKHRAEAASMS